MNPLRARDGSAPSALAARFLGQRGTRSKSAFRAQLSAEFGGGHALDTSRCLLLAVCHECRLSWAARNYTRDEGVPFEFGNQVLISSHRKPLSSKATVVNVAETSGHDLGRHG